MVQGKACGGIRFILVSTGDPDLASGLKELVGPALWSTLPGFSTCQPGAVVRFWTEQPESTHNVSMASTTTSDFDKGMSVR